MLSLLYSFGSEWQANACLEVHFKITASFYGGHRGNTPHAAAHLRYANPVTTARYLHPDAAQVQAMVEEL